MSMCLYTMDFQFNETLVTKNSYLAILIVEGQNQNNILCKTLKGMNYLHGTKCIVLIGTAKVESTVYTIAHTHAHIYIYV